MGVELKEREGSWKEAGGEGRGAGMEGDWRGGEL